MMGRMDGSLWLETTEIKIGMRKRRRTDKDATQSSKKSAKNNFMHDTKYILIFTFYKYIYIYIYINNL